MHVMDIPNLAERLSCVLFKRNFDASVAQIRHHLGLMASAAKDVKDSADFKLLLQFVLAVGNFMNSGTAKGAAQVQSTQHTTKTSLLIQYQQMIHSRLFKPVECIQVVTVLWASVLNSRCSAAGV